MHQSQFNIKNVQRVQLKKLNVLLKIEIHALVSLIQFFFYINQLF
jgi:hypothetical protein